MATKRLDPAARLAKLQEKQKEVEAEIKAGEQKRLAAIGSVVAELLQKDEQFRSVMLPILQAVTAPRLKAVIDKFLTS